MAQAVQIIWPEVKVTIGPVIENGFFYDFDSPFTFTEEHLERIEKEMQKIIDSQLSFDSPERISQQDGIQIFSTAWRTLQS
jgi:threonyl-tRNA synthetase